MVGSTLVPRVARAVAFAPREASARFFGRLGGGIDLQRVQTEPHIRIIVRQPRRLERTKRAGAGGNVSSVPDLFTLGRVNCFINSSRLFVTRSFIAASCLASSRSTAAADLTSASCCASHSRRCAAGARTARFMFHAGERGVEPVIVGLPDRVELMVVAAAAIHRQPQQPGAGGRDDVVHRVRPNDGRGGGVFVPNLIDRPGNEKTRRRFHIRIVRRDLIAGELLEHEAVERLVGIQRANDIIAIGPRIFAQGVDFVSVALAEADHVEPMPPPLFAIMRRGKQPIDEPLVSVGRIVGEKRGDLLGRRRQAQQIVGRAADEGPLVGRLRGVHPLGGQLGKDESVDRIASPRGRNAESFLRR